MISIPRMTVGELGWRRLTTVCEGLFGLVMRGRGGQAAGALSGPSPGSFSCAAVRRPAPPPRARESARSRGASLLSLRLRSGAECLAAASTPSTLRGSPCLPRPGPAALPSAALRLRARRGRGRGPGRGPAGKTPPGRRAAAGMRGWRRNLALCLQRLPDEGMTRPRPVSTRAARGREGGPSGKLTRSTQAGGSW